jgi:SGNH hydrolase-like domain, acetyltransferase AlgX
MLTPKLLVITTFLLIVGAPPVVQVAVEAARGDRPAALEIFARCPTAANLRGFEKALQNDSIVARALRPVMQAIQFFAFRDAGDKALIGPRGWLFYQPGVSFLTQRARPGDSTVKDAVAAVVRFRDDLAKRGIRLIVLPAPNKESVYPDQLSRFAAPPEQAIGDETRAFLAEASAAGVEVVDLFVRFGAARRTSSVPLYLEQDSHWSPAGMEMAASAVAERIFERGWLAPGSIDYVTRPAPVREIGDLVEMLRSPQIEARVQPEHIATTQVVRRDTGALFTDDRSPEVLVLGDSFMRIYQQDSPGRAGFVAHLALALGRPVAGIVSDGGASTLVRQDLNRRPRLLSRAKVVVWEFVERDIRLGAEGWQIIPLPPAETGKRTAGIRSAPHAS